MVEDKESLNVLLFSIWVDGTSYWNLRLIHNFYHWGMEGVESLIDYLYSHISLPRRADCVRWRPSRTGMFSVHSHYECEKY